MFDFKPAFYKRSELLDVIRAIAVILVLVFHVTTVHDLPRSPMVQWFAQYGFLGVDIFFPLSGFLITTFLLKYSGRAAIGSFFLRRTFRILPLYALALLMFVAAALVTGVDAHLIDRIWINAAFLTGWFIFYEGRETVAYTITWSLSVEEFAYITLGLLAWLARRYFVVLLWIITGSAIALRFWLYAQGAEDIYYFPPARLDSIALGALLAVAHQRGLRHTPAAFALAFLVALALSQLGTEWRQTLLFVKLTLITCVVIGIVHTYLPRFRSIFTFPLAIIGFYSYFIYLFHFFVIYALELVLDRAGYVMDFWLFTLVVLGLTTAAGYLSYAVFEGPLMKLGRKLEPKARDGGHRIGQTMTPDGQSPSPKS